MDSVERFMVLFGLLGDDPERVPAFGTGRGEWIKRPLAYEDAEDHLAGRGPGVGVPPLRHDGTVRFAAIDLDEPDFDAAREMQGFLPGTTWLERSRSGNAHVWAFFSEPIEAWIVRGIMKEAILAAGKGAVEIFPKQDKLLEGMMGNYINLPYHGESRPVLCHLVAYSAGACGDLHPSRPGGQSIGPCAGLLSLAQFLDAAEAGRNDPDEWRKRARWLMISPPEQRERLTEFGTQPTLHICAEWIVAQRDENPLVEGHRAAVFFALAKMFSNYEGFDHDESLGMMKLVNDSSPDPAPESELRRILHNAERGRFTSTDCDNPLVAPYAHPDCPILKRSR